MVEAIYIIEVFCFSAGASLGHPTVMMSLLACLQQCSLGCARTSHWDTQNDDVTISNNIAWVLLQLLISISHLLPADRRDLATLNCFMSCTKGWGNRRRTRSFCFWPWWSEILNLCKASLPALPALEIFLWSKQIRNRVQNSEKRGRNEFHREIT